MNSLIGMWMFTSLIYQGQPMPRPNQSLEIYLMFETADTNEILYFRNDEKGFCRRKAKYEVNNNEIRQTVVSIDEGNADFCSQDTDMQIGNVSVTKFELSNGELKLYLPLGDDVIVYVWEKH